jgi:hypothetical protein
MQAMQLVEQAIGEDQRLAATGSGAPSCSATVVLASAVPRVSWKCTASSS